MPPETEVLLLKVGDATIEVPIVKTFEDVAPGSLLAYKGSSELLEIAIREGDATRQLQFAIGDCLDIS